MLCVAGHLKGTSVHVLAFADVVKSLVNMFSQAVNIIREKHAFLNFSGR